MQTPFFKFVYTDFKTAGISKGWQIPLHALRAAYGGCALHAICGWCDSGFPIGVKAPCWHTTLQCISLVCYTFCDRGRFKGVVRRRNKHFELTTEQADDLALRDIKCVDSLTRNPVVRV